MSVTERFNAVKEIRLHNYWIDKHLERRHRAAIRALNNGKPYREVSTLLGVGEDTMRLHGIVRGADPDAPIKNVLGTVRRRVLSRG